MTDHPKADQLRAMREANFARYATEQRAILAAHLQSPPVPKPVPPLMKPPEIQAIPIIAKPKLKAEKSVAAKARHKIVKALTALPVGVHRGWGGRPRKGLENETLKAKAPWKEQGISRPTYFRNKRKAAGV